MSRLEEALDAYDQAIMEHPGNVMAYNGRAETLKEMGRLSEALDAYDQAIMEYPNNAVAKIGRAEVLRQMGRQEDALAAYEYVIMEHPENVVAKIGRAETLREMGQTERRYASHYGASTEIDEQQGQKYQDEGLASISSGLTNNIDPFRIRGTILNKKYKLLDFAGSGGMGAVYRALSLADGSTVAIKILQPHILARSPEYAELFERETKNAQSLDHPHIVKVFDGGKDEDLSYMVMEWVEGRSIEDALTQGQLPLGRLTNIFGQLCSAVAFAHERNIIHLDLKPGNILLLDRPEPDDFVKVIDFGLSRVISKESGTTVTKFRGTHQFCAPEQFGGKVSHRSDIYSLGATLYYLLTGVIPFGTSYINAKIHPNLELPKIPSLARQRDLPPILDDVIGKSLEKDPNLRQQSARQLYREFHDAIASIGINIQGETERKEEVTKEPAQIHAAETNLSTLKTEGQSQPLYDLTDESKQVQASPVARSILARIIWQNGLLRSMWKARLLIAIIILLLISTLITNVYLNRLSATSVEARLQNAIRQNNLFSPPNENAYALYLQLKNDPDRSKAERFGQELIPILTAPINKLLPDINDPATQSRGSVEDWRDASKHLEWAIEIKPGDSGLIARKEYCDARIAYERRDSAQALAHLDIAGTQEPSWALPFNLKGVIYNERKDYLTAREYFSNAIEREPRWAVPYNNLGTTYFYVQQFSEAERYYRQAAALAPNWARPHAWLGEIAERRADYQMAVQEYQRVLDINDTTMNLGAIRLKLEKLKPQTLED